MIHALNIFLLNVKNLAADDRTDYDKNYSDSNPIVPELILPLICIYVAAFLLNRFIKFNLKNAQQRIYPESDNMVKIILFKMKSEYERMIPYMMSATAICLAGYGIRLAVFQIVLLAVLVGFAVYFFLVLLDCINEYKENYNFRQLEVWAVISSVMVLCIFVAHIILFTTYLWIWTN